nr:glycosyltransferase family 1 protein [Nitrosomonas nitrosa]
MSYLNQVGSTTPLSVGVYMPPGIPQSFRVYSENVLAQLSPFGIKPLPFDSVGTLPRNADVLWDIRSGGGNPPPDFLVGMDTPPLVVTIHGLAPISLKGWEYFTGLKDKLLAKHYARGKQRKWVHIRHRIHSVIAVSNFTKNEAIAFTGISADRFVVCHHGVDSKIFRPTSGAKTESYFFHVSNDEPRKNIHRIVNVFIRLRRKYPVELVLKLPREALSKYQGIEGVRVITGYLNSEELAELYRNALAFVFPSLYEGFGMPILEAMSCGCPVITSNVSACPEVADQAALIVDPRSEEELETAMAAFFNEKDLYAHLASAGLQRSKHFSWVSSATCHARVFFLAAQSLR